MRSATSFWNMPTSSGNRSRCCSTVNTISVLMLYGKLPITAIGIGVGIDYGIYLLSRICEEYQLHESYEKAIAEAVGTTGKAIFFTATIVLIAILPWYFLSELKFLADMGLGFTGVALLVGGTPLSQLWLVWVAQIVGGLLGGVVYKCLGRD